MGTGQGEGNWKFTLLLIGDYALKNPYEDLNTLVSYSSNYSNRTFIVSLENSFEKFWIRP